MFAPQAPLSEGFDHRMAPPNLTRAAAQERAALLRVAEYTVDLDLTTGDDTIPPTTVVRFASAARTSTSSASAWSRRP